MYELTRHYTCSIYAGPLLDGFVHSRDGQGIMEFFDHNADFDADYEGDTNDRPIQYNKTWSAQPADGMIADHGRVDSGSIQSVRDQGGVNNLQKSCISHLLLKDRAISRNKRSLQSLVRPSFTQRQLQQHRP